MKAKSQNKKTHKNIPVFIPHLGCKNDCVFCNQRAISGKQCFEASDVENDIRAALSTIDTKNTETEIAFFGGSFTGIDRSLMIYLLEIAKKYLDSGQVSSVRLSTRPDYINEEILELLKRYGVKTIELGIQSFSDAVLSACKRGHDAVCAKNACRMIKLFGFSLVGQMMIGLPLSQPEDEMMTAEKLCELHADAARIYPTVVFYQTELKTMTERGLYRVLTFEEAVERCAQALEIFYTHNIPVLRVGLCDGENLYAENGIYAGAFHPAIGEFAQSRLFLKNIRKILDCYDKNHLLGKSMEIYCPSGAVSKVSGQKKCNKILIQNEYNVKKIKIIENDTIIGYNIKINIGTDAFEAIVPQI